MPAIVAASKGVNCSCSWYQHSTYIAEKDTMIRIPKTGTSLKILSSMARLVQLSQLTTLAAEGLLKIVCP